jgi:hypothetical protein
MKGGEKMKKYGVEFFGTFWPVLAYLQLRYLNKMKGEAHV